jgi:hypothetical protein
MPFDTDGPKETFFDGLKCFQLWKLDFRFINLHESQLFYTLAIILYKFVTNKTCFSGCHKDVFTT